MGFLKRLFSLGGKKNKKRQLVPVEIASSSRKPSAVDTEQGQLEEEEHEAAVGRLLRSSSTRYAVVKEIDYSNLPPLPHPINEVLAQCKSKECAPSLRPSPSTASLAGSTISRHSTFSVTVRDRQRHAATEFPNANRDLRESIRTPTPQRTSKNLEDGHPLALRSDPSVASLIEMYDEHGRLPPEAFSNSPEKRELPQKKRNGSTLRELLGASDSLRSKVNGTIESDISWAERFLDEVETASSHASFGPDTPPDSTCANSANDPAINSMEVELSLGSETSSMADTTTNLYSSADLRTPKRASQVFSFLTKQNAIHESDLPSEASISASDTSHNIPRSRFSSDCSYNFERRASRINFDQFPDIGETPKPTPRFKSTTPKARVPSGNGAPGSAKRQSRVTPGNGPGSAKRQARAQSGNGPASAQRQRVLMNGPTKVIVTAPTPGTGEDSTPSRIPIRGPRQLSGKRKTSSPRRTPMLTHRMNTTRNSPPSHGLGKSKGKITGIPSRKPQRRNASQSSNVSSVPSLASELAEADAFATARALDHLARSQTYHNSPSGSDKENRGSQLGAKVELPSTPLRNHMTGRRKTISPNIFPSSIGREKTPLGNSNSSSELSPLGKQMMLDARKQRMLAREGKKINRRITLGSPS